jgi:hypothetical protein
MSLSLNYDLEDGMCIQIGLEEAMSYTAGARGRVTFPEPQYRKMKMDLLRRGREHGKPLPVVH